MKNLILITLALFTFGAVNAQGKSKNKSQHVEKGSKNDNNQNDVQTGIFPNDQNNGQNSQNQKFSKNAPAKVREAFARDFPGVRNARWTKSQGVWTANYYRTGIFGGGGYVSYNANGERVN